MGLLKFEDKTFRKDNKEKVARINSVLSIDPKLWDSWCIQNNTPPYKNFHLIHSLYIRDLVIEVVDLSGFLFFVPPEPEPGLDFVLSTAMIRGEEYEDTANRLSEYYQDIISMSCSKKRFLEYQAIFNDFVEFALK